MYVADAGGAEGIRAISVDGHGYSMAGGTRGCSGKHIIDSGRLGQITFVHTYRYQHATAGNYAPVSLEKLD